MRIGLKVFSKRFYTMHKIAINKTDSDSNSKTKKQHFTEQDDSH
jgi:hypothetical protein